MSVLIKGMEMPKNCGECRLCHNSGGAFELGNDYCCLSDLDVENLGARPNFCPLVPVPPHGRLIDADVLKLDLTRFYRGQFLKCRECYMRLYDALEQED